MNTPQSHQYLILVRESVLVLMIILIGDLADFLDSSMKKNEKRQTTVVFLWLTLFKRSVILITFFSKRTWKIVDIGTTKLSW